MPTIVYKTNAKEKMKGLEARINKDHTNSSKPSSQDPIHKTIPNGREKSGKRPGGQKGHEHPPEYFKDGYNLYKRLSEEKETYTLFLTNPDVEPNNNAAERLARKFKRKCAQVMCFRSQTGVDNFCDGLSIIQSLKAKGKNLFDAISQRFRNKTEA